MKIKVVGLDPSLRGFGIAQATIDLDTNSVHIDNLILPDSSAPTGKSVRQNSKDLASARILHQALVDACEGRAMAIAEVPVGSQSARAMASYGISVGVLSSCPIPLIEVTPLEVKMISVGTKTATKAEVIAWAIAKHPEANWAMRKENGKLVPTLSNEHRADAVAAIYAGMKTQAFKQACAIFRGATHFA